MLKLQPYNLGKTSESHRERAGLANHGLILLQCRTSREAQSSLAEVNKKIEGKKRKREVGEGNMDERKGGKK